MTDKEFTIKWGIHFDCFELNPIERKQQRFISSAYGTTIPTVTPNIPELTGKVHSHIPYQPADFWMEYTRCKRKEDLLFNCNVLVNKSCMVKIYNGYFTAIDIFLADNTMDLSFNCEYYETIFY